MKSHKRNLWLAGLRTNCAEFLSTGHTREGAGLEPAYLGWSDKFRAIMIERLPSDRGRFSEFRMLGS